MSDWMSGDARREATWNFINRLNGDRELRRDCVKYPWIAREVFKEIGGFSNMPASVEFRILEEEERSLDSLVVIFLPRTLGDEEDFDVKEVWRCCWSRWGPSEGPTAPL